MNESTTTTTQPIAIPHGELTAFCAQHHIRKLSLFGSVLRDDFGPDSDVDILVEFEPGARVGLFDMGIMQIELSEMLGRAVDLKTAEDLSRYFRQKVLAIAQVQSLIPELEKIIPPESEVD